jgi:hypothetical protein
MKLSSDRRPGAIMKWQTLAIAAGLVACRTGGPSGSPLTYVSYPVEAGADTGSAAPPGDDGDTTEDSTGGDAAASDDAPSSDDVVRGDGASSGGGPGGDDAAPGDEGGTCTSPMVTTCDPVHNTGCTGTQCDVNGLGNASALIGQCVFNSSPDAAPDAGSCIAIGPTESCPPKFTCVSGACSQLCFCDTDCPTAQCCSGSGPGGFKLCGACSP